MSSRKVERHSRGPQGLFWFDKESLLAIQRDASSAVAVRVRTAPRSSVCMATSSRQEVWSKRRGHELVVTVFVQAGLKLSISLRRSAPVANMSWKDSAAVICVVHTAIPEASRSTASMFCSKGPCGFNPSIPSLSPRSPRPPRAPLRGLGQGLAHGLSLRQAGIFFRLQADQLRVGGGSRSPDHRFGCLSS